MRTLYNYNNKTCNIILVLQVLCWGVRDMKRINLLQAKSLQVEIECGGATVQSKIIENANKNPNFPDPVISMDVVGNNCNYCDQIGKI